MLLQAGGRTNTLCAPLKAEQERGADFLHLANAFPALYPKGSEGERREAIDRRDAAGGAEVRAGRTPQAVVIAGPNGAGKTSSAPDLLQEAVEIDAFVNADVIAQGLAAFSPE